MRVALLTHSTNPRGGVVHTLELARALKARGVEVTVIAPRASARPFFRDVPCRVDLFDIPPSSAGIVSMIGARIEAYVDHLSASIGGRPRIAHFDLAHAQDGIGANALATLRERGQIGGFVRTVHHVDRHPEDQLNVWEERAVRGASQVLCVSQLWRDRLRHDFGVDAAVVENGVNLEQFSPCTQPGDADTLGRHGVRSGAPLIVSVGGIERRKNTVRILEAFALLRIRFPHAQLAIVGGASILDHSQYRAEFARAVSAAGFHVGVDRDVVLTGPVADGEVAAFMRAADAVAFPSLTEGFGLVALESLACGTPTVVSRIAPFTEYLKDGEVFWADPENSGSIAEAMRAAVSAPEFQPPAICAQKSWDVSAAQHMHIYRQFMANTPPRVH